MSRRVRLNVGMLDDDKNWVQKFSQSQSIIKAIALDGSPWHLPFSHRIVAYRVFRDMHIRICSFVFS